jgi:hypothetical protein
VILLSLSRNRRWTTPLLLKVKLAIEIGGKARRGAHGMCFDRQILKKI